MNTGISEIWPVLVFIGIITAGCGSILACAVLSCSKELNKWRKQIEEDKKKYE